MKELLPLSAFHPRIETPSSLAIGPNDPTVKIRISNGVVATDQEPKSPSNNANPQNATPGAWLSEVEVGLAAVVFGLIIQAARLG